MNKKVESVSLYLRVLKNREGLLKILQEKYNILESSSSSIDMSAMTNTSVSESKIWSNSDSEWCPHFNYKIVTPGIVHRLKRKIINFDIILTYQEWIKIKPIKKKCRNNKIYKVFKPEWTDLIVKKIKNSPFQLPCAFNFIKHRFLDESNFEFSGMWKEKNIRYKDKIYSCGNFIFGKSKILSKRQVVISITTQNTKKIKHQEKRFLKA